MASFVYVHAFITTYSARVMTVYKCNCLHIYMTELEVAGTSPSFVALLLLVSEIAKYIA